MYVCTLYEIMRDVKSTHEVGALQKRESLVGLFCRSLFQKETYKALSRDVKSTHEVGAL